MQYVGQLKVGILRSSSCAKNGVRTILTAPYVWQLPMVTLMLSSCAKNGGGGNFNKAMCDAALASVPQFVELCREWGRVCYFWQRFVLGGELLTQ